MIVIRTEKDLIASVESWTEIEGRPGFTKDLDPREHSLKAIIGRYAFKDEISCGLSTCHQPHGKGYIVATSDGRETNIGKDCGKRYFGVDFETLSRQFDRDVTAKEYRDSLWSFYFSLDEVKRRLDALNNAERGANWIHRSTRPLVEVGRGVPTSAIRRLEQLVKTGSNRLTRPRLATEAEAELLRQTQAIKESGPLYVDEDIAHVQGLDALSPQNDLRQLLVLDLEQRIQDFEQVRIDELSFEALKHWSKWAGNVGSTLERARDVVESGRRLLTQENLTPVLQVMDDRKEAEQFREYLKTLPRLPAAR